ncbi:MAG: glycosyltransferase family 9 protein [Steroidobacter sp.]
MAYRNEAAQRVATTAVDAIPAASTSDYSEIRTGRVERLLVVRFGAFGDMVLMTPMLRRLRQRFGATIDLLSTGQWTEALLRHDPGIGEIQPVTGRRVPYALSYSQQAAVRWLRERGPTPTWFCQTDPAARHLLRRAGIPDEMICDIADLPGVPDEHAARWWLRFADETPPSLSHLAPRLLRRADSRARLHVSEPMRMNLRVWLQRRGLLGHSLVLIQAGNKRTMRPLYRKRRTNTKYWPEERWASVIRAIHEQDPSKHVVLMGTPGEHALNEEIRARAGVPCVHNVARDLPIDILLPLLEIAHSMIGVDTGPAHAAAALNCPQVTLFGEASPTQYFPGGERTPTTVLTGESDGRVSMMGIQAHTVIDAWVNLQGRRFTLQPINLGQRTASPLHGDVHV